MILHILTGNVKFVGVLMLPGSWYAEVCDHCVNRDVRIMSLLQYGRNRIGISVDNAVGVDIFHHVQQSFFGQCPESVYEFAVSIPFHIVVHFFVKGAADIIGKEIGFFDNGIDEPVGLIEQITNNSGAALLFKGVLKGCGHHFVA